MDYKIVKREQVCICKSNHKKTVQFLCAYFNMQLLGVSVFFLICLLPALSPSFWGVPPEVQAEPACCINSGVVH